MPPELVAALIAFIGALLVALTAIVAFLPKVVQRQLNIRQAEQETRIKSQQKRLDDSLEAARQEREEAAEERKKFFQLIDSTIERDKRSGDQNETMVKALTRQVEIISGVQEELRANRGVASENVELLGDLSSDVSGINKNFALLMAEGSRPLQAIHQKVDEMAGKVASLITSRDDEKATMSRLTEKIDELNSLKTTLNNTITIMEKAIQAKMDDVRKVTGESGVVINVAPNAQG